MGRRVLSAAWQGTHTVPGTGPRVLGTPQTANDVSAGRISDMGTRHCSVWTKVPAVGVASHLLFDFLAYHPGNQTVMLESREDGEKSS